MPDRREMGALEGEILVHLWASDQPLSAADVRRGLASDLAYSTVMTVLTRLWQKHVVERQPRGRAYVYWPVVSEGELTAQRMRAHLERTADRESALTSFVGSLSNNDEQALRRILDHLDRRT
jgi:predicted transcriptional regulator